MVVRRWTRSSIFPVQSGGGWVRQVRRQTEALAAPARGGGCPAKLTPSAPEADSDAGERDDAAARRRRAWATSPSAALWWVT